MPLREFTDRSGRAWQAWNTVPGSPHEADLFAANTRRLAAPTEVTPAAGHVSPGLEHGWLTFQAGPDKRRLSPIPAGWATASEVELDGYLSLAAPVHISDAAARLLARAQTK